MVVYEWIDVTWCDYLICKYVVHVHKHRPCLVCKQRYTQHYTTSIWRGHQATGSSCVHGSSEGSYARRLCRDPLECHPSRGSSLNETPAKGSTIRQLSKRLLLVRLNVYWKLLKYDIPEEVPQFLSYLVIPALAIWIHLEFPVSLI